MGARFPAAVAVALAGVMLLGACSDGSSAEAEPDHVPQVDVSTLPDGAEIPAFTGSWAAEFERAFRNSTSDLQRQVLADGRLTEQEMLALQDDFRVCAEGQGLSDIAFDFEGGFEVTAPDDLDDAGVNEIVTSCQATTIGDLDTLFRGQQRNPGNEDELEIMAACLVRQGLVPSDYGAEDYGRDAPAGTLPFDLTDSRFGQCVADPLTAGSP